MMFSFGNTGHEPVCKQKFFRLLTTEELLAQNKKNEAVTLAEVFIQPPSDGMDREWDSGDKDTGGTVNNLSGKHLQANAEAIVASVSQSQEGNEGDNQIGFVLDSIVDRSQSLLDMVSFSTPAPGLRHKKRDDG